MPYKHHDPSNNQVQADKNRNQPREDNDQDSEEDHEDRCDLQGNAPSFEEGLNFRRYESFVHF